MKSVTAKYTAEELITMRAQVGQEIKETLEEKVNDYGIIIDKFNIVNFDFSEEFNLAIEAKQVAEQNLLKTKTEQEQAIVIANAEAEKKIIAAEAEAESTMKRATAQAEANRMLNESLNNNIIEYEKIQKAPHGHRRKRHSGYDRRHRVTGFHRRKKRGWHDFWSCHPLLLTGGPYRHPAKTASKAAPGIFTKYQPIC